jgi:uncharacterized phosphosugar-binding protein
MSEHLSNSYLTSAEFERSQKALERRLDAGFSGIETRLYRIENGTTAAAERLAVLEAAKKQTAKKQASWITGAVVLMTVIAEVVRKLVLGD